MHFERDIFIMSNTSAHSFKYIQISYHGMIAIENNIKNLKETKQVK